MIDFKQSALQGLALHRVGNKQADEGILLSHAVLEVNDVVRPLLLQYFLSHFTSEDFYHLSHPSDINLNEVFNFASIIFDHPNRLFEQSVNLAQHLYHHSTHPKIRGGEFYVAHLTGLLFEDQIVDALGIFKSESKETYLKILPVTGSFEIGHDSGINISKLDKGCLIFNTGRSEGFIVAIVDTQSKGTEAQYWRDDFLQLRPRSDNFYKTKAVMDLCKKFVSEKLPQEFEVSRADQVDLLNRSMKFLKENEAFEMEEFTGQVLHSQAIISSFSEFKHQVSDENNFEIPENFQISGNALKKQARFMKSVIKLDKNFHIYIHGEKQMVEKGFDEQRQMNYYKLFFKEEL
jgi:hypothetical protein